MGLGLGHGYRMDSEVVLIGIGFNPWQISGDQLYLFKIL